MAPTRTELTIAALPLLIIVVGFASRWMGAAFARAATAAVLLAQVHVQGFRAGGAP